MRKPKVAPRQLDLWTYEMSGLYQSLEGEIIRIIIKRLNKGHDNILDWQAQKLHELGLFNDDVTKLLSEVTEVAESEITRIFNDIGIGAIQSVDSSMPYDLKPIPTNLDTIMRGYSEQTWLEVDNYVNQTLITTQYGTGTAQRAYTEVLNETQAMFNTGMYDFKQSLERAVRRLAQKGIDSGMVDKGNNVWSLESYVRTVLKSTLGNTYDAVRKERMAEYGVHTVVVTAHAGAR